MALGKIESLAYAPKANPGSSISSTQAGILLDTNIMIYFSPLRYEGRSKGDMLPVFLLGQKMKSSLRKLGGWLL